MIRRSHTPNLAVAVHFWGVRGSVPVSGPSAQMFGGNTSCIEVTAAGRRFIVDAGTGIIPLGATMNAMSGDHFDILLTHLHHDHVIGLMAFAPCFVAGVTIDVHCGHLGGETAETALRRLYSPPLFPVTFDELPASVRFRGFTAGETLAFGEETVRTCPLNHPGGATAYRFDQAGGAVAVLTDTEHEGDASDADPALAAFCRGADLLVYDATWDDADYPRYRGWGHSTWEAGVALARASGAARLACFHHAPEYDDARLGRMEAALQAAFAGGFFAREGQRLVFGPQGRHTEDVRSPAR